MAIPFIAYEISGVKQPTYGSGAANKAYVDAQVVAAGGVTNSAFQTLTASTGLSPFTSTVKVSGSAAQTLTVLGYATISSNAKSAQQHLLDSGAKYHGAYISASTGVFALDTIDLTAGDGLTGGGTLEANRTFAVGAGTGITVGANDVAVTGYATISANAHDAQTHLQTSGAKYHQAYLSGQRVGDLFNHNLYVTSANALATFADSSNFAPVKAWYTASAQKLTRKNGWASVPDGNPITHGLGVIPGYISVTPSGQITFGWSVHSITTSSFKVSTTSMGNRTIGWRAEV